MTRNDRYYKGYQSVKEVISVEGAISAQLQNPTAKRQNVRSARSNQRERFMLYFFAYSEHLDHVSSRT
jgi:hypothetical protein